MPKEIIPNWEKRRQKGMKERFVTKDLGMSLGAAMNKAVDLVIALMNKNVLKLTTKEEIQKEITYWRDWIFQNQREKQNYESIPIVEEKSETEKKAIADTEQTEEHSQEDKEYWERVQDWSKEED